MEVEFLSIINSLIYLFFYLKLDSNISENVFHKKLSDCWVLTRDFNSVGVEGGQRLGLSNKFPGVSDAVSPGTSCYEPTL